MIKTGKCNKLIKFREKYYNTKKENNTLIGKMNRKKYKARKTHETIKRKHIIMIAK